MPRVWRQWTPRRAELTTIAPHRYTWDDDGPDPALAPDYDTWKALVPYKPGEAIYVERGGKAVKALILDVHPGRDSMGFRQEVYRIVLETAKGLWSKSWERVHPGAVQRGYHRAGLAPDLDGR